MSKVRIGVVGCGAIAQVQHVPNLLALDEQFEVPIVCDALPGQGQQELHADWGEDYDGRFHVCNSVWLLDDFGRENGCTRLVPGTHKGLNPGNTQVDRTATHPDEEYVIAPAGTVAVFNSQIWHGGTLNRSADRQRRAMHCYFTAREYGQQLDQAEYIRLSTWKRISPSARYILDVDLQ